MGDWSILGRFLAEVQNHSTVIGKIWLTVLLIFRILLVTLVGDAVYSDEQSKFTCNTLQPGCNNVCYDTFAPVSHLRFWVFQIVLVSTPSIFYIIYVLHKITKDETLETERVQAEAKHPLGNYPGQLEGEGAKPAYVPQGVGCCGQDEGSVEQSLLQQDFGEVSKDPTTLSSQVLLIYIVHVLIRSVLEITFLVGQYYLFGFEVPHLFRCETYPCPTQTDCFVSRATEKTIFLNFMFSTSLGCFLLNIVELHYLGWIYIFRMLCAACFLCCRPERELYPKHNLLLQRFRHSMRGRLVLQSPTTALSQEKTGTSLLSNAPAISFETDSSLECTSKWNPEERERMRMKLANMARFGGKKSWL
ncbi:gap junction delta-2 protein-like [Myxocyprinus asiaticus]|uniref:gap junction delta-2 protein-like n=1 Tax=Myxocyprinus asiaticus TaxID=70543 RepID=UPI0022222A87|nr:gap junction delta-2 protein-like [Myxocyprinus asiaticus]